MERFGDGENAAVGWMNERVVQVLELEFVIGDESVHALPDHAESFLNRFFKTAPNRHDFPDGFHGRADLFGNALELRQIPAGDFHNAVVQRRLEERACGLCNAVFQLVEVVPHRQFGGDKRQRIAGRLAGKSGRPRQTGVDFDNAIVLGIGV